MVRSGCSLNYKLSGLTLHKPLFSDDTGVLGRTSKPERQSTVFRYAEKRMGDAGGSDSDQHENQAESETPTERLSKIFAANPSLGHSKTLGKG